MTKGLSQPRSELLSNTRFHMQLSPSDLIHIDRELSKRSLAEFAKAAWHVLEPGTELKWNWVLDGMCEHLEAVTDGRINRLLMNVPPGFMKSLLVGVIWPAWEWGPKNLPHMRIVGTAHEENLAVRDSRKCRDLIKSEWYQARWGLDIDRAVDGKREFGNNKKGIRQARAFTSMTGVRGDRVILDDPISADNANSPAKLEAVRVAFTETLPTRINNDQSAIVVIMQRLNQRDVSGIVLDMELPYTHFFVPMEFEADNRCTTSIGWSDPRAEEGELAFPERFGPTQVAELKKTLGSYGAAGQLQQRPAPRGGGVFKDGWWQWYKVAPAFDFTFCIADTAQKEKEQNDFSVVQFWGARKIKGGGHQAYLIDQVRGKWEAPDLRMQAKAFWAKCKATACTPHSFFVEDKVSGTGLIQDLKREGMPMIGIQREKDKVTRAYDTAPYVESGHVFLPEDAPFISDLLAELSVFPNGTHDDQVDPLMDAISNVCVKPFRNAVGVLVKKKHRR